jgi:autotransporter translocation and assembly factor TamB
MIKKLIKYLILAALTFLVALIIMLASFQTDWVRERLQKSLFELAQKEGYTLKIGSVKGELPFKWTLSDVAIQFNETDSLHIDTLRIRFSILPLLRKQIAISYFHIENADLFFRKQEKHLEALPLFPWAFSVKAAKVSHLVLHDVETGNQMTYTFQGKTFFKKKGKAFAIEAALSSSELSLSSHIEGNKKADTLSGFLKADVKSAGALSPIYSFPTEASFLVDTTFEGHWDSFVSLMSRKKSKTNLPIKIVVKTEMRHLELKNRDLSGTCETWLSLFPSHALDIHHISLKSDLLCLKGEGSLDETFSPKRFSCSFLLPHLSYLSSKLGGILTGETSYTPAGFSCAFESEQLKIASASYDKPKGSLQALFTKNGWDGTLKFEAPHPAVPIEFNTLFSFSKENFFTVKDLFLTLASSQVAGDGTVFFSQQTAQGSFFIRAADLSPLALFFPGSQLKGSLASVLSFNGTGASFYGLSQNMQCYDLLSHQITLKANATDLFLLPQVQLSLDGQTTYLNQFLFDQFTFSTHLNAERSTFDFAAIGEWKDPFNCTSSGSFHISKPHFDLQVDSLKGSILKKSFEIQKPFSIQLSDRALVMSEFDLKFKEGFLLASMDLNPTISKIRVKAEHFPIDLLALSTSRFTLQGNSSLDIVLDGSPEGLKGRANIFLEKADILQSGKKVPIHSKGSLQINLDQNVIQIHSNFKASDQQFFEITAGAPIVYNFYPLRLGIDRKKPLWGELTMEGHLEEIFDFINIGSHSTTGLLSCHLLLSNTLNDPRLQGTLDLQNGSYQNYFTGIFLKDIYAEGRAEKGYLKITSIKAKDQKKGLLTGLGTVLLAEKIPFSFDFNIDHLQLLHINWLTGLFSGPVTISGNTESALAKGELLLNKAQIEIPDQLPVDLPTLPFEYINKPPHVSKMSLIPQEAYPFYYDLILHAPGKIFLSGRGLNAELQGNLALKGKNLSVEGEGSLDLIKGIFSFSGKEFTLNQGALSFVNSPSPQAYLNLSGTLSLPEMTVTALLRGPLTAQVLTLQSNPTMPTSSILARILFNKDVSELSALQAAQLAYSIVSLSGNSGPNVFEMIRKSLGVDRLNISAPSGDSDQFTVQIGKYLTKGVMITLSQSTETSHVIVEVELKNGFVLQAETQENEQAKFSLKWNKNY